MIVLATLLGALLTAAAPRPGEPTFQRAYLRPEGLCFESPVEIDWEALARREFKEFSIDKPRRDLVMSRSTEMQVSVSTYPAALPDSLKRLHFYLLTEAGPQPIVPKRLLGSIQYDVHSPANPRLEGFHGEVCLPAPKAVTEAGFVAVSSVPLSWRKAPADLRRSKSGTVIRHPKGSASLPPSEARAVAAEVKTAYILTSAELPARYVFVRRAPECPRVCCEFAYDIYRWDQGLSAIAWNAYGCDI